MRDELNSTSNYVRAGDSIAENNADKVGRNSVIWKLCDSINFSLGGRVISVYY